MTVIVLDNRLIDIFRTLGMSELENYFRLRNQGEKLLGSETEPEEEYMQSCQKIELTVKRIH